MRYENQVETTFAKARVEGRRILEKIRSDYNQVVNYREEISNSGQVCWRFA